LSLRKCVNRLSAEEHNGGRRLQSTVTASYKTADALTRRFFSCEEQLTPSDCYLSQIRV
jgi:hypothetical protein